MTLGNTIELEKAYKKKEFLSSPEARTIRILAEYLEPESRFRKHHVEDTIVFFGSARTLSPEEATEQLKCVQGKIKQGQRETSDLKNELKQAKIDVKSSVYYQDAVELAKIITGWSKDIYSKTNNQSRRFIVCSGGGPGIMEAANKGASEANGYSIGLNISLPFEQDPNPYITSQLSFEFHYFFIRKFWFTYLAKALVVFPGGFGTIDELMELLTLVQTKKITKKMPILLYGKDYWDQIINFKGLLEWGMISPEDLDLFYIVNTPEEAFQYLRNHLTDLKNN
ncbi:MAG: Rossman fold protein, TIGR00730 family [Candidatus Cloacimonetes bacterium 4572_55]|nr:MAG: Rossman fold protein, TIGR00730 family [Candidatus Cloacimonetes bacterium 4572_55]